MDRPPRVWILTLLGKDGREAVLTPCAAAKETGADRECFVLGSTESKSQSRAAPVPLVTGPSSSGIRGFRELTDTPRCQYHFPEKHILVLTPGSSASELYLFPSKMQMYPLINVCTVSVPHENVTEFSRTF